MAAKILVNQTAFLGDLVLGAPLFKQLRLRFPQSEITLICRKGLGEAMKAMGLVDIFFEVGKSDRNSYQQTVHALKNIQFDLLLSPHESFRSALFVSQLKAKKKIGYKKWWNFLFFDERVEKDEAKPEAIRQLSLLKPLWPELTSLEKNISPLPEWASPIIPMPLSLSSVKTKFSLKDNYVCLFPGSVWATKKWTVDGYIKTGQHFSAKNISVLVMGGPGEEALCSEVAAQIANALSLAGKTSLLETTTILSGAKVVVTNDSGGQHLAALSGVPTVAIFGPTVPEFGFIPWNNKSLVVETKGLACRPCGKHGPQVCPIGTHECMTKVQAAEVITAAESILI